IYDERISDKLIIRLLKDRVAAGVEVRVIGRLATPLESVPVRRPVDMRLHVRAIVRDSSGLFMGSQSLRKNELDVRREIGMIVNDTRLARKVKAVFESDWAQGTPDKSSGEKAEAEEKKPAISQAAAAG